MKHLKIYEIWGLQSKKHERWSVMGYKIGDWILIEEQDDKMRSNMFNKEIMVIRVIRTYGDKTVLIDVNYPNGKKGPTFDFSNVVRKLTDDEIKIEKMKIEAEKYNL